MSSPYDVVVVGLGHAGCEAALAAARMGLKVAAVTLRRAGIAVMSCNPAIGGTAKGHLVRELDALGGEMARAADLSGTHFKVLNESKGPAVRATRVLCDRERYAAAMQKAVLALPNLTVLEDEVQAVAADGGRVEGVRLRGAGELRARAVVVTTGTFLEARMHVGEHQEVGGRLGDGAATGLSDSLRALGFELGRFKTGTPPRLLGRSIDWRRLEEQPSDPKPRPFSLRTKPKAGEPFPALPLTRCHLTWTNERTHRLVRENLHRSPLHRGAIVGRGPRYCPSLEDKVVRFAERARHQVFLEPEGVDSPLVYPAGLSTSLPPEVQLELLRTLAGLEEVEVARFGYAVEYDYAPPTQLLPTLETRRVAGLYFAGQLNGTSGYEEAAVQGLWAGINAGLKVKGQPPMVLGRSEAHLAVLVDELVSRGVDEPFRMLTSRSEHRLKLREGNADLRLRAHGHRVGLVTEAELEETRARGEAIASEVRRLKVSPIGALLRRPGVTYASLAAVDVERPCLPEHVCEEVEVELKYEGYIAQAERAAARGADACDGWEVPADMVFETIRGLPREAAEKLSRHRPATVGHARRIPGLTPAAVDLLVVHLRRMRAARPVGPGPVENVCESRRPSSGPVVSRG